MGDWKWNGPRWWKFDFHTHTPESDDYGRGKNQKDLKARSPREWLLDYMQAGIDCVAVTDHNTGEWIDSLKEALSILKDEKPDGFRPIHLFPGVEISVHGGIHVLTIFDSSKSSIDINRLLGAVDYQGTQGKSDGVTRKSFSEVIEKIDLADGIAIPAHVDEENGLFKVVGGNTLKQALECDRIIAMELTNPSEKRPQLYIDEKLRWTEVLGSDAHHPSGNPGERFPGSHFTWVKMDSPDIKGLRLALLDGAYSVHRSDEGNVNPNEYAHLVLEAIEISKARYLGRSDVFALEFNPWLNSIIGGRGTGKSTVIEFLRIALRRENELEGDLKQEFEKYREVYPDRKAGGLLTPETKIYVTYRKNGSRFCVQWDPAGDLEPIQQYEDGKWQRAEGDINQRFPVRIYSQKQIFQLAKTPHALLRIIDDAPEVNFHDWSERRKEEESKYILLCAKIREIEDDLKEEQRFLGELDDVKRKLEIFEQEGYADILKAFRRQSRQRREIELWEESWTDAGIKLRNITTEIVPDHLGESPFNLSSAIDNALLEEAVKVQNSMNEINKSVESLAAQVEAVLFEWLKIKDESPWKRSVDSAVKAYQELQDSLEKEGAGDPRAYGELVQRRQTIEQRLKRLDKRKIQVGELKTLANQCLHQLLNIRRELTKSRRDFLEEVLSENKYVRIKVVPYGDKESVEEEFRRLIQREDGGFVKDIGSPSSGGLLGELFRDANDCIEIEQNLKNIKEKIAKVASGNYDIELLEDKRFASHLRNLPSEAIDRFILWFPEDSLDVQYSTTSDGNNFRSIQEGSPGQKTAALLAFLLPYGEEPLILDQPEDDLDNHLIYNLIVTQLRQLKCHRQIIVVTHNANIVVNGDSELVFGFIVGGGETQIECEGCLQEKVVRETICDVMEGGRKAFKDRYRRIALEEHNV